MCEQNRASSRSMQATHNNNNSAHAMDTQAAATALETEHTDDDEQAHEAAAAVANDGAAVAAPDGKKRKLDKQTKRAAAKLAKKTKRAEFVKNALQQRTGETAAGAASAAASTPASAAAVHSGTQKRQGALTASSLVETDYFFTASSSVRGVVSQQSQRVPWPYWYEFSTYAKRRWVGKAIIHVLKSEYGNGGKGTSESETESYYRAAITSGAFRIGGSIVSPSYVVRDGDHFLHYLHRHETPVCAEAIQVRFQDASLLVVDKPSSIPVHPCGNYRHNSLLYILAKQLSLTTLFVVHRLDAVTSGLLLMAKDSHTARRLSQQISDKEVRKEYVARVQGRFPEHMQEFVLSAPIYQRTTEGRTVLSTKPPAAAETAVSSSSSAAAAATAAPSPSPSPAAADAEVDGGGDGDDDGGAADGGGSLQDYKKESVTVFAFLAYDAHTDSSLVKCCPLTGRTHQIRLHLLHLGFPIANDLRYGGRDTTSSQTNDLSKVKMPQQVPSEAASSSSDAAASAAAATSMEAPVASSFNASVYWADPAARKRQLAKETPAARFARIQAESVDHSGSCPICEQAKRAPAVDASATVPESAADVIRSFDSAQLSSTFSSTRVRVEYIWLHAFKYSFDATFKDSCRPDLTAGGQSSEVASAVAASSLPSNAALSTPPVPLPSSPSRWSYEIPWPQWALEIAPEALARQHETVNVHKSS